GHQAQDRPGQAQPVRGRRAARRPPGVDPAVTTAPGDDPARGGSGTVAAMSSQETNGGVDAGRAARTGVRVPRWLAVVAVVILVAGLATLGVFGAKYLQARSAQEVAQEREAVADV